MTTTDDQKRQLARAGNHLALAMQYLGPEMRNASPGVSACWDELNTTASALGAAGVVVDVIPEAVSPPADSLEALRRIEQSRSESERLLAALAALLPLAEAVDKRRGNWVGDMAQVDLGETPGTNYAEQVQELHLKLAGELGPRSPSEGTAPAEPTLPLASLLEQLLTAGPGSLTTPEREVAWGMVTKLRGRE